MSVIITNEDLNTGGTKHYLGVGKVKTVERYFLSEDAV